MQNSTMEFMKEYEIMQTIQHENIVRYLLSYFVRETQATFFFPLRSLLFENFVILDCLEWFWTVQES